MAEFETDCTSIKYNSLATMQLTSLLDGCCNYTTALVGISAILGVIFLLKLRRPKNLPPGPHGLPIVGYAPFLGKNAAETMRKMKAKYGPVMSIQMGMEDWVVLNDYESINEGLVKQGEKFSGRPINYIFDLVAEGYGIFVIDYGPSWKNMRKFGLATLRGFGVGKKGMEENVVEETPFLVEVLTSDKASLMRTISFAVSNIICRVVFGSRFSYDDKRFNSMIDIVRDFVSSDGDGKLLGMMVAAPALRHIPPFSGALKRTMASFDEFADIFREIIVEHKESFDENDIRDFIDAFLKEMKDRGEKDAEFCDKQLLQYIRDLFNAGSGTTSTTLYWAILAILHHPECQEMIFKEIEAAIGENGVPSMKHRDHMPYTCAFIQEIMRYSALVPLSVIHKTNADATIFGYTVPKETPVLANIWSVHNDPDLFENPREFRPERFLGEDGKFVKSSHVIPFSVGPRHCLGKQLANMEIFIFLTGIVQKLKLLPDPSYPPPPLNTGISNFASTYEPTHFEVKFEKR